MPRLSDPTAPSHAPIARRSSHQSPHQFASDEEGPRRDARRFSQITIGDRGTDGTCCLRGNNPDPPASH